MKEYTIFLWYNVECAEILWKQLARVCKECLRIGTLHYAITSEGGQSSCVTLSDKWMHTSLRRNTEKDLPAESL